MNSSLSVYLLGVFSKYWNDHTRALNDTGHFPGTWAEFSVLGCLIFVIICKGSFWFLPMKIFLVMKGGSSFLVQTLWGAWIRNSSTPACQAGSSNHSWRNSLSAAVWMLCLKVEAWVAGPLCSVWCHDQWVCGKRWSWGGGGIGGTSFHLLYRNWSVSFVVQTSSIRELGWELAHLHV